MVSHVLAPIVATLLSAGWAWHDERGWTAKFFDLVLAAWVAAISTSLILWASP